MAGPPTNEAGASTLPERKTSSVPSTTRSSKTLTKTVMVLPLLAPRSKVTSFRNRVKSSPSVSERNRADCRHDASACM